MLALAAALGLVLLGAGLLAVPVSTYLVLGLGHLKGFIPEPPRVALSAVCFGAAFLMVDEPEAALLAGGLPFLVVLRQTRDSGGSSMFAGLVNGIAFLPVPLNWALQQVRGTAPWRPPQRGPVTEFPSPELARGISFLLLIFVVPVLSIFVPRAQGDDPDSYQEGLGVGVVLCAIGSFMLWGWGRSAA